MNTAGLMPTAIVAHHLWGRGGAEAAAMWIIEALSRDFDVTVYTRGGFDLADLNALAGTSLHHSSFRLMVAKVTPLMRVGALANERFNQSLFGVGRGYDLRVTLSGVLAWGRPAVHFMSSVEWCPDLVSRIDASQFRTLRMSLSRWMVARRAVRRQVVSGDVFIANSAWLKQQCAVHCPGPIRVIHPVVPYTGGGAPWEDREDAVLVFGRISPEKHVEDVIRIVEVARSRGFVGRLIIAGPGGASEYVARIKNIAARHDWIELLPSQYGDQKARLLGRIKYGINACRIEAFGISTAEMAASGIVTLVPVCTGQSDIVDNPLQRFSTEDEAVEMLLALSRDLDAQRRLHFAALDTKNRFTPGRFVDAVRALALDSFRDISCQEKV